MNSLNGIFTGGIRSASRAGYEAVFMRHVSLVKLQVFLARRREKSGEIDVPSATAKKDDVTRTFCTHGWETGPDDAERPVEVDFHLIADFILAAHIYK